MIVRKGRGKNRSEGKSINCKIFFLILKIIGLYSRNPQNEIMNQALQDQYQKQNQAWKPTLQRLGLQIPLCSLCLEEMFVHNFSYQFQRLSHKAVESLVVEYACRCSGNQDGFSPGMYSLLKRFYECSAKQFFAKKIPNINEYSDSGEIVAQVFTHLGYVHPHCHHCREPLLVTEAECRNQRIHYLVLKIKYSCPKCKRGSARFSTWEDLEFLELEE